ncbi:MAG TPA: hypothetical protein VGR15_02715 [Bacteroidota bacterium]|jgi:hypothetical protein|nr:hypothetical protein [Bacteroidota bacterium]
MAAREQYFDQVEKEFAAAGEAQRAGNHGKVRVCARRAVGHAISWFLSRLPQDGWGVDAMSRLERLREDTGFPREVREAAERLTTKISERFTYPFSTKPIEDARIIVDAIVERTRLDAD